MFIVFLSYSDISVYNFLQVTQRTALPELIGYKETVYGVSALSTFSYFHHSHNTTQICWQGSNVIKHTPTQIPIIILIISLTSEWTCTSQAYDREWLTHFSVNTRQYTSTCQWPCLDCDIYVTFKLYSSGQWSCDRCFVKRWILKQS